jgi:hypothetical protein
MANFEDILNRKAEDIKPPVTLPMGSYHTVVVGMPEQGKSSKKKTDFLKFTHRVVGPLGDVDPDAIAEFESDGETIAGQEIENTFYFTDKAIFMFKEFVENCGVDVAGKTVAEWVEEVPNSEVVVHIKHETSEDGKRTFARVGSTAKLEA